MGVGSEGSTPTAMLPSPSVLLASAESPFAVFFKSALLFKRASTPVAVLRLPVVLLNKSECSVAGVVKADYSCLTALRRRWPCIRSSGVGKERARTDGRVEIAPPVLLLSENKPTPVLYMPVVRLKSAFCPSAVFPPG